MQTIDVPSFTMAVWVASSRRVHPVHLRRETEGPNPAPSAAASSYLPLASAAGKMARTEEPIEAISAARSFAANRRVHTVGGIGLGHYRFDQRHMRFHAGSHWALV
jgi:hypothetical protein